MSRPFKLRIQNFAQIRDVQIGFGDLTVLVGPQGAGKSLALQWLKVALDGKQVINALRDAGSEATSPTEIIDLIFGVGMGTAWRGESQILIGGKKITPRGLSRIGNGEERVFFIPAHRSMLISDGWASPFQRLTSDTPVVARIFSQNLFDRFSSKGGDDLFPRYKRLKKTYREIIDDAVFHGGTIGIDQDQQHSKRLKLSHGDSKLPFMTWTAGQREFTPLLLGLYHLLPHVTVRKRDPIDWVVIEEPEMGLHPQAITAFLLLVLDLLWRGYRVILSTHSPHVLTAVWMLQRLKENHARWQLVCRAMGTGTAAMKAVAEAALQKDYRVYFLEIGEDGTVTSKDISSLDPGADEEGESGWGGLTGFSSKFGDAVREAVNESAHA